MALRMRSSRAFTPGSKHCRDKTEPILFEVVVVVQATVTAHID